MISCLTAKNNESCYSFHARAKAIEESLQQTNSAFGPNELLLRYIVQLNRCQQHRDHAKTDLSNMLSQIKQHGDNDNNLHRKNIDEKCQMVKAFNDAKILNVIDDSNNKTLSIKNATVSANISAKES